MSIKVDQISKIFGTQKALDGVSLEVKKGEIVGLLGPNGAGKTTLMRILTCFLPPTSGDASVCSYDIIDQPIQVRGKVGYLPENNPLYMDMYVKEYLGFVSGIYKLGRKTKPRIAEMIEITGLQAEQTKKIGALSKGYRQRVGLAQALIHDPEVLILDEPTSGLDPNQIIEIRELIKKVGKEKTVLLSTHIMQEVEAICHRAIIIDLGKIIADDLTANLSADFSGKNIITVEFNSIVDASLLKAIGYVTLVRKIHGNLWEITTEKEHDIRNEIFRFAVDNNISVLSMQKEEKSMEDVFHALTKK
jgi:ABC-2 type transport system ATP-binding protein